MKLTRRNRRRKEKREIRLPQIEININWSRIISAVAAVVVVGATYVSTLWLMDRPIESVVINGEFQRVTAMRLEEILAPHLDTGFLSADLPGMQAELVSAPWVARADVRRRWPGTIEVLIVEERAVARWGEQGLLNVDGELFVTNAKHVPAELPRLEGPDGTESRVTALYFRLEERLEQRGVGAVALSLSGRGSWEFELSNGIRVRLGSRLTDQRLDRFFVAFDQVVAARPEAVAYVDMRYTNGFAIGWKAQEETQPNV